MAKKTNDKVKSKEFRRNNARTGHPAYIVSVSKDKPKKNEERQKKAKFLGVTEAPKTHGVKNVKLDKNPNPNSTKQSYVRPKVEEVVLTEKTFGNKLTGWEFSTSDKKKVRIIIEKDNKKFSHVGKPKR